MYLKKKKFNTTKPKFADLEGVSKEERTRLIHELAQNGEFSSIPHKYLTTSYLTKFIPGEQKTALHYAAQDVSFYFLPKSVLRAKNLLLKDKNGVCACDTLLESGSTVLIPKSYYTPKNPGIKHAVFNSK